MTLPGPPMTESRMRLALTVLGLTQLAIGAWLVIDPDSFVDAIAPFGPRARRLGEIVDWIVRRTH